MKQDRLLKVLAGPVISDKAAVELLFKVKVDGVQILNVKGKVKRAGRNGGVRSDVRKAYVTLAQGQEINFAQEVK